jgi:ubiquinone/menaquinone biosynthesis C-methylase UbiE
MSEESTNRWDADDYDDGHAFVHEYGESVVDLLDPQPDERVLDMGCGTGHLTAEIADAVERGLRGSLYDETEEAWTADYRRVRFEAVLPG